MHAEVVADLEPPRLGRAHVTVVAVLGVAAVLGTGVLLWSTQPRAESVPLPAATASASGAAEAVPSPAAPETGMVATGVSADVPEAPARDVVVHVAGRIQRPGVVVLPAGSRVVDAVEAAGGALPDTSLESVNLARLVSDGEQVRVGLPPDPTVPGPAEGGVDVALDLNSADVDDLDALPGIGPVLARRIVDWRAENGPFTDVGQLMEVAGIGPSVLDDLTGKVRV